MSSAEAKAAPPEGEGTLLKLAGVAILAGAGAGLLGSAFILALKIVGRWAGSLIAWSQGKSALGCLILAAACALATALAARWVRRYSTFASGSGIPQVEAVLSGEMRPAPMGIIPVKFIGGTLAISAGLALGREGPCVQMGARAALQIGRIFRRTWADCRVLMAAGAGAGLATAFNAPIAGAVFVLEELMRRFDTRTTIATFAASASAIAVSREFLGQGPVFRFESAPYPGFGSVPIYLCLGILAGALGVLYNRVLLSTLAGVDRLQGWWAALFPAMVGAFVGVITWFHPNLVGGGDGITQSILTGAGTLSIVGIVFLMRFALGSLSYAAGTPGGLFAPMLVLGAQSGWLFATVCDRLFPQLAVDPKVLAVVGMAAFFTAVVRAPLTGIILIIEMTNGFTLLLPMLTACFAAMLLPTLIGNEPIYESLRSRLLRRHPNSQ
jgi:CIC family chloride channel protein